MLKVKFKVGFFWFEGYLEMFYYKEPHVWYVVRMEDGRKVHTKEVKEVNEYE